MFDLESADVIESKPASLEQAFQVEPKQWTKKNPSKLKVIKLIEKPKLKVCLANFT